MPTTIHKRITACPEKEKKDIEEDKSYLSVHQKKISKY